MFDTAEAYAAGKSELEMFVSFFPPPPSVCSPAIDKFV
jgi:hypothetical protein